MGLLGLPKCFLQNNEAVYYHPEGEGRACGYDSFYSNARQDGRHSWGTPHPLMARGRAGAPGSGTRSPGAMSPGLVFRRGGDFRAWKKQHRVRRDVARRLVSSLMSLHVTAVRV